MSLITDMEENFFSNETDIRHKNKKMTPTCKITFTGKLSLLIHRVAKLK